RQELELIEANNKMKVIDDNLVSIEKEYSATKAGEGSQGAQG
ncbi:hypothetical protein A2U01_0092155, partial [Trifolium medium]|nr:hypothetical protein [Trifolium medium]